MDVKSKIASFEAFNENVIRTSPERTHAVTLSPTNSNGGGGLRQRDILDELDHPDIPQTKSTTSVASQSRRSRLQRAMNVKQRQVVEPGSLMQKRLNDKQRRLENMNNQSNGSNAVPSPTTRQQIPDSPYNQQQQQPPQQQLPGTGSHASPPPSSVSRTRSSTTNPNHPSTAPNQSSQHNQSNSPSGRHNRGDVAYSSPTAPLSPMQQHHSPYPQQQQTNSHRIGGSNNRHDESSGKTPKFSTSRYRKLKMKGMDHAKLVQKRKGVPNVHPISSPDATQQARQTRAQPQQARQIHHLQLQREQQRQGMLATPTRSHNNPGGPSFASSPAHNNLQESPDHTLDAMEDDDTLTSVRQIVDQEPQQQYPKQPQYPQQQQQQMVNGGKAPWIVEEKSEKALDLDQRHSSIAKPSHAQHHHTGEIYLRPSSSSEFEPDTSTRQRFSRGSSEHPQTPSPQHQYNRHQKHQQQSLHHLYGSHQHQHRQNSNMAAHDTGGRRLLERSGGSYTRHVHQSSSGHRLDDDERTFDYGVKDDDSQDGSVTFQRQLMEAEMKTREQSTQFSDSASMDQPESVLKSTSNLINEDLKTVRAKMDTPAMKTAASVIGAATLGCIVVGPVGMLLGAAAVGIGVGIMQIPEEQRSNMAKKASEAMAKVEESAYAASETLSNSCANTYKDSGIAEHIPAEMKFCAVSDDDVDHAISPDVKSEDSEAVRLEQITSGGCGGEATLNPQMQKIMQEARKQNSPNNSRSLRSKKVACLRQVRIMPVSQIHSLEPGAQPRAWLDVLASSGTTHDEKIEAMEEILILAKDKQRAKIFLDEGILDSLIWILSRYFEKLHRKPTDQWAHPDISPEERVAARLAATCCVTLGKAHCAAIHTEGDLLLMSLYERGTVPEERQLAQCLYEIPHHARVTKTNDPTVVDPSMEVFALKQLTLPQAEELARSIKELSDSR